MKSLNLVNLFAMLTSSKGVPYWWRMQIPVEHDRYADMKVSCQSILESLILSYVQTSKTSESLFESWDLYCRRVQSRIKDSDLLEIDFQSPDFELIKSALATFSGSKLSMSDAENILNWSTNYFQSETSKLVRLMDNLESCLSQNRVHFESDLKKRITTLFSRLKWRRQALNEHFSIAHHVYRMSLPDPMEMLLQDIFFDGVRDSYWWMDSVGFTLEHIGILDSWLRFETEIGDAMAQMVIHRFFSDGLNLSDEIDIREFITLIESERQCERYIPS